jgi:hypothetical protein
LCSISSETQKLLGKLERKDRRRRQAGGGARSGAGADAELDWLSLNGFDALVEAEVLRASAAKGQARRPFSPSISLDALDAVAAVEGRKGQARARMHALMGASALLVGEMGLLLD